MNKILLYTLAIAMTIMSCQPASKNDKASTSGYAAPVLPDQNIYQVRLLLSAFWVAEYWVDHANPENNRPNKGRWWRFTEDGIFYTGQWEQTYSIGSWVVHSDGQRLLLHMDAADNAYDMQFELQQVSEGGDYMSWVGTELYGMSRIAVKAISLLTQPTKEQFGVQD